MASNTLTSINAVKAARAFGNLETAVLDTVEQAVIATDLEGKIIFWNRYAERLYGWRADEVIGQNILDVTPNAESKATAFAIFEQLKRGESWSGEFAVRDKSGTWFHVRVTDTPIYDEDGTVIGVVGVSTKTADWRGGFPGHRFGEFLRSAKQRIPFAALADASGLSDGAPAVRAVRSVAIALAIIAAATGGRAGLDLLIPDRLPFITFFPAVLAAAYFCGLWSTVFVIFALALSGAFWVELPPDQVLLFRVSAFALFTVFGSGGAALVFYMKYLLFQLRARDEQLALVNHELKHRIKNLFAIVSSICVRSIRKGAASGDVSGVIVGRISAVASAQELLSVTATDGSDLRSLIDAVVVPIAASPARLKVEGPHVKLPQRDTTSLALILHELATNAVKHGAWAAETGTVSITWQVRARELDFVWREQDVVLPAASHAEGFGTELIRRALNRARVDHTLMPDGLTCRIRLDL